VGLEKIYFLNQKRQMASKTSQKRHKKQSRKQGEPSIYQKFLAEHKDATRKRLMAKMYPGRSLTSLTQHEWLKLSQMTMKENAKAYRQKYPEGTRKKSEAMSASKSKKRKGSKKHRHYKETPMLETALFSKGYKSASKVSKKSVSKVSKKSVSKVSKKSVSKVSKKSVSKVGKKSASKKHHHSKKHSKKHHKKTEAYATKSVSKSASKKHHGKKHHKKTESYATKVAKVAKKSVSKTASKKRKHKHVKKAEAYAANNVAEKSVSKKRKHKKTEAYSADKSGAKKMSLGYLLRYF